MRTTEQSKVSTGGLTPSYANEAWHPEAGSGLHADYTSAEGLGTTLGLVLCSKHLACPMFSRGYILSSKPPISATGTHKLPQNHRSLPLNCEAARQPSGLLQPQFQPVPQFQVYQAKPKSQPKPKPVSSPSRIFTPVPT